MQPKAAYKTPFFFKPPFSTKSFHNEAASLTPASPGAQLQVPLHWTQGTLALLHKQVWYFLNNCFKTFLPVLAYIYIHSLWNRSESAEKMHREISSFSKKYMENLHVCDPSNVYCTLSKKEDLLLRGGNLPGSCVSAPYSSWVRISQNEREYL